MNRRHKYPGQIKYISLFAFLLSMHITLAFPHEKYEFPLTFVDLIDRQITGSVTNEDNQSLIGATILAKGTTVGTLTDEEGKFSLNIPDTVSTLIVSFIGYATQEVDIQGRSSVNIVLIESISSLDEIVVTGYGSTKRRDLTGAISSVSGEDLDDVPTSNVIDQAQGRLAGVDIVKQGGFPGARLQITIRGNRSINASNASLIVIDGIPSSGGEIEFNQNDIASIEVLKDASAVAIYGSRGANGVVLITTKRGKAGKKAEISYDGYYGLKYPYEHIDLMNGEEYAQFVRVANGLVPEDASNDEIILDPFLAENMRQGISTDWMDEILQTGTQQDHQL